MKSKSIQQSALHSKTKENIICPKGGFPSSPQFIGNPFLSPSLGQGSHYRGIASVLVCQEKNLFPIGGKRSAHGTPVSHKALPAPRGGTLAVSHRAFCICSTICRAVLALGGSEYAQDWFVERVCASMLCSASLDPAGCGSAHSFPSAAASGSFQG